MAKSTREIIVSGESVIGESFFRQGKNSRDQYREQTKKTDGQDFHLKFLKKELGKRWISQSLEMRLMACPGKEKLHLRKPSKGMIMSKAPK
jgi:hypothetical protein